MIRAAIEVDYSGLRALGVAVTKERAITLKAVKAGARIVQAQAKANAPRRKGKGGGALQQAQGVKAVKGTVGQTVALAVIGARKKVVRMIPRGRKTIRVVPAFYAHLVDQGTKAHAVGKGERLGRSGKVATFGRKKGQTVGAVARTAQAGGMHPGTKATKFLERAWQSTQAQAAAAAEKVMAAEVNKAMAKAAAALRLKPKV
jgi:hypothetical protein